MWGRLRPGGQLPDEALAALYDEHGARLYRYAVLILADPAAAEDVVQDAFCQLARIQRVNPAVVTLPYAIRVVRNACYTMLRKRRTQGGEAPLLEPAAPDATEEDRPRPVIREAASLQGGGGRLFDLQRGTQSA